MRTFQLVNTTEKAELQWENKNKMERVARKALEIWSAFNWL
jgi:hypothetical protein